MGVADTVFHVSLATISLASIIIYIKIYTSVDWKVIEYQDPKHNESRAIFKYGIDKYCKVNRTDTNTLEIITCRELVMGQKPFPVGQLANGEKALGTLSDRDSREVVQCV